MLQTDPALSDFTGSERFCWFVIALIAGAVLCWIGVSDLTFDWRSAGIPMLAVVGITLLGSYYRTWRDERSIGAALIGLAQVVAFTMVAAPLSYCLVSLARPFWDARLYGWDRALGFDWLAYLAFVDRHPVAGGVLSLAYQSLLPQMAIAIGALGLSGRLRQLRVFVLAVILSGLVTIVVSGVMPAMAMFVHLGLQAADYPHLSPAAAHVHVAAIEGLRSGALRTISLDGAEGLITFPSYHAALGLIFLRAFWSIPLLRWPGVVLNAMLIAATPIDGGHYFVDVIAGLAAAALILTVVERAHASSVRQSGAAGLALQHA